MIGNTVNLGSRLQEATKQLGVSAIAEGASVRAAGWEQNVRRLSKLQVVGIDGVVEAYEIPSETTEEWLRLRERYERALEQFEQGQFAEATSAIGQLLQEFPRDKPCQLLLERAVRELANPSPEFTGVCRLSQK